MQRINAADAANAADTDAADADAADAGVFARAPMPPPKPPPRPLTKWWQCTGTAVAADARARLSVYSDDWTLDSYAACSPNGGARPFTRLFTRLILPASLYAFVNSALPAVAFGAQLAALTDGLLTPAHTLLATAAACVAQALVGGQPLLVVGVSEPVVLIWAFMAAFCRGRGLPFLAFAAWASVFASILLALAALAGMCARSVALLTRFSCEVFGSVISMLFAAVAIKGLVGEFALAVPPDAGPPGDITDQPTLDPLRLLALCNGLWAVIVALGVAATALKLVSRVRIAPLANYGALIAVAVWTAVSFAVPRVDAPGGRGSVPRRVPRFSLTALADSAASAAPAMADVRDGWLVAAALVPGSVVAALFFFDHNVSSRMSHDACGHPLAKPTAFDLDLLVCAIMTLALGLCGLPPTNGVIPQTPIMARSLLLLRPGRRRLAGGDASANASAARAEGRNGNGNGSGVGDGPLPPLPSPSTRSAARVLESRWPNLIQGLLCGLCVLLVPSALPLVPLSVVYGFFIFLALEPLGNMQLWRGQLWCLFTDAHSRALARPHPATAFLHHADAPPLAAVAVVSSVQVVFAVGVALLALLAGIAGVCFPVPLLLLLPLRWRLLPSAFDSLRWRRRLGARAALDAIDPPDADAPLVLEDTDEAAADDADDGVDADAALAATAAAEEEDDEGGRRPHGCNAAEEVVVEEEEDRERGLRREARLLAGGCGGDDGPGAGVVREGGRGGGAGGERGAGAPGGGS